MAKRGPSTGRRDLLRLMGAGAGAALLGACAPIGEAPNTPAAKPAATTAPAATAAPAASAASAAAATKPAAATATQPAGASTQSAGATAQAAAASGTQPAAGAAAKPGEPAPRAGGTLRAARLLDLVGPAASLMANPSYILTAQVYNALIRYDEKFQPVPELAESWEISKDGKQVTLKLRKGVTFHTGREFTSDDVKYNLMRVRDPKLGMSQLKTMSEWVSEAQTPDKNTVIFQLPQPRAAILDLLGYLFIADKETTEGPDAQKKGVGTGPFALAEWVPGQRFRFTKNKNYWQSGRPYLDEIVVQVVKDAQTMGVQLESGALDLVELLPEDQTARYAKDSAYRVVLNELSGQSYYVLANCAKPPLDNKKVRQALNYAFDRQRFVNTLLAGIGEASATPWPPSSPAYDPAKTGAYKFDLDKTKALLGEAGVSNLQLELLVDPAFPALAKFGEVLQADLAKVGVKLSVTVPEPAVLRTRSDAKDYQLYTSTFAYADLEPSSLMVMAVPWLFKGNSANFQSDAYQKLVETTVAEPDAAKRKTLDAQLTDMVLDESFAMPLARRKGSLVMAKKVHGPAFRTATTQVIRLEDAWMEA